MQALADRLKALADPTRLAIVEFLRAPQADRCSRSDGVCGCDMEGVLGLSQPTVSHHMKVLVSAGLVRAEKRGRWVYYELDSEAIGQLADELDRLRFASAGRETASPVCGPIPAGAGATCCTAGA